MRYHCRAVTSLYQQRMTHELHDVIDMTLPLPCCPLSIHLISLPLATSPSAVLYGLGTRGVPSLVHLGSHRASGFIQLIIYDVLLGLLSNRASYLYNTCPSVCLSARLLRLIHSANFVNTRYCIVSHSASQIRLDSNGQFLQVE